MIYEIVVPQFTKVLANVSALLDAAEAYAAEKKFDVAVLLQDRLAPDQFHLLRQVQVACDTAKLGAARLSDTEKKAPTHDDSEQTLAEIKARIDSTVAYLNTLSAKDFDAAADRRVTQPRWNGKTLSGEEFLIQHVIPNFYFHTTMVHAILRHNGVSIGKSSYLGAMPYREAA